MQGSAFEDWKKEPEYDEGYTLIENRGAKASSKREGCTFIGKQSCKGFAL